MRSLAARVVLSVAAAVGFGVLLCLAAAWHPFRRLPARSDGLPGLFAADRRQPSRAGENVERFWPQFPDDGDAPVHRIVVNGVTFLSQEWRSSAPARDVVAYYREQMLARGWSDTTRETLRLPPLSASPGQEALARLVTTVDSSLTVNRGDWSLWVMTASRENERQPTEVRILAADTPSIQDFGLLLASALSPNGPSGRSVEAVQDGAGLRSRTVLSVKEEPPGAAFAEIIAGLQAQGWRTVVAPRSEPNGREHFAWLDRGRDYACLVVRAARNGAGSEVALTELSP
jgi:hypothetical protein